MFYSDRAGGVFEHPEQQHVLYVVRCVHTLPQPTLDHTLDSNQLAGKSVIRATMCASLARPSLLGVVVASLLAPSRGFVCGGMTATINN